MADYKQMYLALVKASEKAINILIEAQREAEDIFIATPEPELEVLPAAMEQGEQGVGEQSN